MERSEGIVVLDAGNGSESVATPESWCCLVVFGWFMG